MQSVLVAAFPLAQKIIEVIHIISYHPQWPAAGDWPLSVMLKVFPGANTEALRCGVIKLGSLLSMHVLFQEHPASLSCS